MALLSFPTSAMQQKMKWNRWTGEQRGHVWHSKRQIKWLLHLIKPELSIEAKMIWGYCTLRLLYFGCIMRWQESLEKTIMRGKEKDPTGDGLTQLRKQQPSVCKTSTCKHPWVQKEEKLFLMFLMECLESLGQILLCFIYNVYISSFSEPKLLQKINMCFSVTGRLPLPVDDNLIQVLIKIWQHLLAHFVGLGPVLGFHDLSPKAWQSC